MPDTSPATDQSSTMDGLSDADRHAVRMEGLRIYRSSIADLWGISPSEVTVRVRVASDFTIVLGPDAPDEAAP